MAYAQPEAGEWLTVAPDGSKGTDVESDTLLTMLQRRANLDLSVGVTANDALEEMGASVDRKGDDLSNSGDYTAQHNGVMYAARDMVVAAAQGRVLLGDKEKPGKTAQFNATHVVDIVEIGGDGTSGRDVLWEIKVPIPTKAEYCAGHSQRGTSSSPATVGHLYGFGNTEEIYNLKVHGHKGCGKEGDAPFNHATKEGWIRPHDGQYRDAHLKRNSVTMLLVETSGGINGAGRRAMRALHRRTKLKGATDGTLYGRLRISQKSYIRHHASRLSLAACRGNAEQINKHATSLKMRAAHAAAKA